MHRLSRLHARQKISTTKPYSNYLRESHEAPARSDSSLAQKIQLCNKAEGAGMHVVLTEFRIARSCAMSAAECALLRRAVGLLHARHLIFGDLPEPNVLTTPGGEAFLIEFDWCSTISGAQCSGGRRVLGRGYALAQGRAAPGLGPGRSMMSPSLAGRSHPKATCGPRRCPRATKPLGEGLVPFGSVQGWVGKPMRPRPRPWSCSPTGKPRC